MGRVKDWSRGGSGAAVGSAAVKWANFSLLRMIFRRVLLVSLQTAVMNSDLLEDVIQRMGHGSFTHSLLVVAIQDLF